MSLTINDNKTISNNPSRISEGTILARFETLKKITEGLYHHLNTMLSVVMIETEIIESKIKNSVSEDYLAEFQSANKKTGEAVEEINKVVQYLRELTTIGEEGFNKEQSLHIFMSNIPDLLEGYKKQLSNSKNISMKTEIDISSNSDFNISYSDIFDYLLLFIVNLMSESIRSGELKIKTGSMRNENSVTFSFDNSLLGERDFDDYISHLFPSVSSDLVGADSDQINASSVQILSSLDIDNIQSVMFIFPSVPNILEENNRQGER